MNALIMPFDSVKLIEDSSAEAVANIRGALKAGGIPFSVKTCQSRAAIGRALDASAGMRAYGGGMPPSSYSEGTGYVYQIRVRRKDEARARELCGL